MWQIQGVHKKKIPSKEIVSAARRILLCKYSVGYANVIFAATHCVFSWEIHIKLAMSSPGRFFCEHTGEG